VDIVVVLVDDVVVVVVSAVVVVVVVVVSAGSLVPTASVVTEAGSVVVGTIGTSSVDGTGTIVVSTVDVVVSGGSEAATTGMAPTSSAPTTVDNSHSLFTISAIPPATPARD
jgi:hypothetical protein